MRSNVATVSAETTGREAAVVHPPILMFNQKDLSVPSGETTHIVELARALSELGERVTVISPRVGRYQGELPFTVRYLPVPSRPRAARLLALEAVLWPWLLTRPEIWRRRAFIYVRKGLFMLAPLLVARAFRLPSILEVNGAEGESAQLYGLSRLTVGIMLSLSRIAYRLARHIITVTPGLANYIEQAGAVPADKISVLHNGANTNLCRPQDREACCAKLGLPPDRRYIVFTGHMAHWHRLDLLVDAMPQVIKAVPEAHLLFVGQGSEVPVVQERLATLGLAHHATFQGPVPFTEVPDWVGAATVCVALATIDRLSPIKLFEYMACGRPVVVTDAVGLAEPVRGSGCGPVCKPEPADLAAGLISVLQEDAAGWSALCRRAREAAVSQYSWQATGERTLAIINRLWAGH